MLKCMEKQYMIEKKMLTLPEVQNLDLVLEQKI
jgi:hypothetical protein